jgi:integrase/recombinase XerD
MLESYFIKPRTVDRIRGSWIAGAIEQYVAWMEERRYAPRNFVARVPLLVRFGEFARGRGATRWEELPRHVEPFVDHWSARGGRRRGPRDGRSVTKETRGPIEQMLCVAVPGFRASGRRRERPFPFHEQAPGFVSYLVEERGLLPTTVAAYAHGLRLFESYLRRIGVARLADLTPTVISAFVVESAPRMARTTLRAWCGMIRVFLRYVHREGVVGEHLASSVDSPQAYRLATLPRSIAWPDVKRVLAAVDRRTPVGRRDYAILLLLVTYGLRAREIVALTLDDIDWRAGRLRIPERKAGHSTAYPLSGVVGQALVDYVRGGRPDTADRHVFFRGMAPRTPVTLSVVSGVAARALRNAGVCLPRAGSHTLRHTCVQRLVDEDFSFKAISDYVGHRSADSTGIYAKVAVEALRKVALGDGEEVLR